MPLPVAALPPAAGAFFAGAAAVSKSLAFHAAPFVDTLSSATVAAWLLRYLWRNKVPDWAKEDVSFQSLLPVRRRRQPQTSKTQNKSNGKVDEGCEAAEEDQRQLLTASEKEEREMANLASVLEKLQALINSVQLDDDHPSILQQNAALLAYIQLSAQIKRQEQQQQQQGPKLESLDDKSRNEEKKEDRNNNNNDDITDEDEAWTSRDSMYENARPSKATQARVPLEYYDFVQNPHDEDSPLRTTLQQALSFATWAYYGDAEKLAERLAGEDFKLLDHSLTTTRPGHVAYYIAVSSISKKQVVIGVRGTSTLEDIVTDCCGQPIPMDDSPYYYDYDRGTKLNRMSNTDDPSRIEVRAATPLQVVHTQDSNEEGQEQAEVELISGHERIWVEQESTVSNNSYTSTTAGNNEGQGEHHGDDYLLRCHEGIFLSAKRLVDRVQPQIEHWVVEQGYQLVLCGHSLGAGCASLAAVLLRTRLPELTHDTKIGTREDGSAVPKMRVYCFAPPPVLDRDAALAASSYCTSIVNNTDMIPRCSIENLLILLEILKGVWEELKRQGLAPTGPKTLTSFFRKIAKGSADEDMLMAAPALRSLMLKAMEKIQANHTSGQAMKYKNTNTEEKTEEKESSCDFPSSLAPSKDNEMNSEINVNEGTAKLQAKKGFPTTNPVPLYIPGIVLLAYEPWAQSLDSELEIRGVQLNESESDDVAMLNRPHEWTITDGTARVLHFLEMGASSQMAMDHATTSYYSLLDLTYEF